MDVAGLMAFAVIPLPAEVWLSQRTGIQLVQELVKGLTESAKSENEMGPAFLKKPSSRWEV